MLRPKLWTSRSIAIGLALASAALGAGSRAGANETDGIPPLPATPVGSLTYFQPTGVPLAFRGIYRYGASEDANGNPAYRIEIGNVFSEVPAGLALVVGDPSGPGELRLVLDKKGDTATLQRSSIGEAQVGATVDGAWIDDGQLQAQTDFTGAIYFWVPKDAADGDGSMWLTLPVGDEVFKSASYSLSILSGRSDPGVLPPTLGVEVELITHDDGAGAYTTRSFSGTPRAIDGPGSLTIDGENQTLKVNWNEPVPADITGRADLLLFGDDFDLIRDYVYLDRVTGQTLLFEGDTLPSLQVGTLPCDARGDSCEFKFADLEGLTNSHFSQATGFSLESSQSTPSGNDLVAQAFIGSLAWATLAQPASPPISQSGEVDGAPARGTNNSEGGGIGAGVFVIAGLVIGAGVAAGVVVKRKKRDCSREAYWVESARQALGDAEDDERQERQNIARIDEKIAELRAAHPAEATAWDSWTDSADIRAAAANEFPELPPPTPNPSASSGDSSSASREVLGDSLHAAIGASAAHAQSYVAAPADSVEDEARGARNFPKIDAELKRFIGEMNKWEWLKLGRESKLEGAELETKHAQYALDYALKALAACNGGGASASDGPDGTTDGPAPSPIPAAPEEPQPNKGNCDELEKDLKDADKAIDPADSALAQAFAACEAAMRGLQWANMNVGFHKSYVADTEAFLSYQKDTLAIERFLDVTGIYDTAPTEAHLAKWTEELKILEQKARDAEKTMSRANRERDNASARLRAANDERERAYHALRRCRQRVYGESGETFRQSRAG